MTARRSSLTGSWSGAFRYPDDDFAETVFNAQIKESGGAFIGTTQEPNLADPWMTASVLTAEIEGTRAASAVTFTKFYTGAAETDYAVRYEGEVNDDLTRIEGVWIIPGEWSGTFFMARYDDGAAAEAETAASQTVEVRK
jgi:hypothetical protein